MYIILYDNTELPLSIAEFKHHIRLTLFYRTQVLGVVLIVGDIRRVNAH